MHRLHLLQVKAVALDRMAPPLRILTLCGCGVILTFPALLYGFPKLTDDAAHHVLSASLFSKQFWEGDLYPRWLADMNMGLGSPAFFYYPPLSYFITSILPSFAEAGSDGWGQLGVSVSLALILSGLCMYVWLRELVDPTPAVLGAVLYMMMPYHLAVDLYTRGAFAEFWSFVWMPLALFFTARVGKRRPFAVAGLAISYGSLIMTHLPTALIFSAVPLTYGIYGRVSSQKTSVFLRIIAGMSLGIALSAIYLVPAMSTQGYVHIAEMSEGYYFYDNWFLFSKLKLWGDETSKLSLMLLFVLAPTAGAIYLALSNRGVRKDLLLCLWVFLVGVFMMTPLSKPLWRLVPPLQMIQFPYRINTLVSLSASALLALGFSSLKRPITRLRGAIILVVLGCVCVWLFATVLAARSAFLAFNPLPEYAAVLDRRLSLKFGSWEFWPRHIKIENQELILKKVENGALSPGARVVEGKGSISVEGWGPREILLQADLQTDCAVHVNQLYYPGWVAEIGRGGTLADARPSEPDGLLSFRLPAGSHQVSVRLERSWPEILGQTISAVFAGILLIQLACDYRKWRAKSNRRSAKPGEMF